MTKTTTVLIEKPQKVLKTAAELFGTVAKAKDASKAKKVADAAEKVAKSAEAAAPEKQAAAKPASKVAVTFTNRTVKKGAPVYVIAVGARPAGGRLLFAHTHAALALFGLLDATNPPAPKSAVLAFIGQTAVNYHLSERNFMEGPDQTIRLTPAGRNKFMQRLTDGKFDPAVAMAFQTLFIDGKADPLTCVKEGNVFPMQFGK